MRLQQRRAQSAYREENTSKMRQIIASRLAESIGPIPTFYLTVEIEMDNALEFRKQINDSIAPEKVSVNDIIVKVAAMASLKHPFRQFFLSKTTKSASTKMLMSALQWQLKTV